MWCELEQRAVVDAIDQWQPAISNADERMQAARHLVPLYPYHATNYSYYDLITFNCVL